LYAGQQTFAVPEPGTWALLLAGLAALLVARAHRARRRAAFGADPAQD
jgi:hypothetical protein